VIFRNRSSLRSCIHRRRASCVRVGAEGAADSGARKANNVQVSDRFGKHIEGLEGFRAKRYRDIAGHWTIGFGHLLREDEMSKYSDTSIVTRDQAFGILKLDVADAERAVNRLITVPLKQEQYDALVSFVYNVGWGQFETSTLLRKLNAGHCCAVPDEMRRWTNHGNIGMVMRRKAEIALYVGDCNV
jgi:lysozyme